jgi:spore maturation protein CgeB
VRIVIFGLTISSSWGNGHATLWRGLCRALAKRGHSVVFYERDVPYYASARDLTEMEAGSRLALYADWQDLYPEARRMADECDAAIVTSFCPDALQATELVLGSNAASRIFYDLDSPVTLARIDAGETVPWVGEHGYEDFDLVLSYAGGRTLSRLKQVLRARRVAPLYGSVDPEVHRPASTASHPGAAMTYMGTYSEDRDRALNALFIEPARRLPERRFLIGGSKYETTFPWLPNIYYSGHVAPADHAAFYRSAPLTLNVTRGPMAEAGYCPSGRLFEAAACGTAVLSDRWDGIEEFYTPGEEILVGETPEDAVAALSLSSSELRRIGERARARTMECHTAERRVVELETLLAGTPEAQTACGV